MLPDFLLYTCAPETSIRTWLRAGMLRVGHGMDGEVEGREVQGCSSRAGHALRARTVGHIPPTRTLLHTQLGIPLQRTLLNAQPGKSLQHAHYCTRSRAFPSNAHFCMHIQANPSNTHYCTRGLAYPCNACYCMHSQANPFNTHCCTCATVQLCQAAEMQRRGNHGRIKGARARRCACRGA